MKTRGWIVCVALAGIAACKGKDASGETPAESAGAKTAQAQPAAPAAPAADPHGATAAPASSTAADAAQPKDAASPTFRKQAGWEDVAVTSKMRVVQYKLPRAAADSEDAELVVYHFPGGGGSVQDNLDRWVGQFAQPDGSSSKDKSATSTRKVGAYALTEIALCGTYVAETSPGSGEHYNKPGWCMNACVIEGPGGPFYAKAVGPATTLERWRPSWNAFLSALAP